MQILKNDWRADLRFGIDDRGEIYLTTKRDGMIRKLSITAPESRSGDAAATPTAPAPSR